MSEAPLATAGALPERGPGGRFLPREPQPRPSPEREALAAAILRRRAALDDHERTTAALDRAQARRAEASRARSRAEAALAEAKAGEGKAVVAALLADAEPGPSPAREAEAAIAAAVEQQTALASAEAALRAHLADVEREVAFSGRLVRDRAIRVLAAAPAIGAALDRLEAAMRELVAAGDAFMWLIRVGAIEPALGSWDPTSEDFPVRVRRLITRLDQPPTEWRDLIAATSGTGRRVFSDALAALETDAAAAVP